MVVTTYVDERNGAPAGVEQQNVTNLNMGSDDSPNIVTATYPITAGENGYEKWEKLRFTTIDNKVDNYKTWISAGTVHVEGSLKTNCNESLMSSETYAQPVATTSTIAVNAYPTSEPSGSNISNGGVLGAERTTDGQIDYMVIQYLTTVSHPAGDIAQLTITFQWDEQ